MKAEQSVFDEDAALDELCAFIASADALANNRRDKAIALDNSRPVFMHRWSRMKNFKKLCVHLYGRLYPNGHTHRRTSWKRQLRILVADIFHCFYFDPEQYIGISLNKNKYKPGSRYQRQTLTHRIASQILHRLHEEGLLDWCDGYFHASKGSGRSTRIRASRELIQLFEQFELSIQDIEKLPHEVILLRNSKGELVEYEDSDRTIRMREELVAYNKLLESTHIDVELKGYERKVKLDLSAKTLHRVFNNESWLEGGRFYAAWWVNAPSDLRQRIVINDKPTREIDFSAVHIALAYAWKGIDYFGVTDADPYASDRVLDGLTDSEVRYCCKALLLSALNASSRSDAIKGVRHKLWLKKKYGLLSRASQHLPLLLEDLIRQHGKIDDFICSGIGLKLQNEDACIAQRIISKFVRFHRPILVIHDSFVVQVGDADLLQETMATAFQAHVLEHHRLNVSSRFKEKYFYPGTPTPLDPDGFVTDDLARIFASMDMDQQHRFLAFKAGKKQEPINYAPCYVGLVIESAAPGGVCGERRCRVYGVYVSN